MNSVWPTNRNETTRRTESRFKREVSDQTDPRVARPKALILPCTAPSTDTTKTNAPTQPTGAQPNIRHNFKNEMGGISVRTAASDQTYHRVVGSKALIPSCAAASANTTKTNAPTQPTRAQPNFCHCSNWDSKYRGGTWRLQILRYQQSAAIRALAAHPTCLKGLRGVGRQGAAAGGYGWSRLVAPPYRQI